MLGSLLTLTLVTIMSIEMSHLGTHTRDVCILGNGTCTVYQDAHCHPKGYDAMASLP